MGVAVTQMSNGVFFHQQTPYIISKSHTQNILNQHGMPPGQADYICTAVKARASQQQAGGLVSPMDRSSNSKVRELDRWSGPGNWCEIQVF